MFVYRKIKWYVTAHIKFVCEGLQGIEESSASFRIQPDNIADAYQPQEVLSALFNLVAGYVSIVSDWKFDSVQILAMNLRPYRPTVGARSFIETPKLLRHNGVVNIQKVHDDYYLLWSILAHMHRVDSSKHPNKLFHHRQQFNDLNINDLQFPLKIQTFPNLKK